MIATPALGQTVQVWYRAGVRDAMPLHGKTGTVIIRSHGRPRNHAVTPQRRRQGLRRAVRELAAANGH